MRLPMEFLLWVILFFIIIYYGFKLFFRYALPWLLKRFVQQQQEKYNRQQGYNSDNQEGDVTVKNKASKREKKDTGFGEYVDFEDINDNNEKQK